MTRTVCVVSVSRADRAMAAVVGRALDETGVQALAVVVDDPLGPDSGVYHVIRGSSWAHGTVTELRLSYRDYNNMPRDDVGFRVARYLGE